MRTLLRRLRSDRARARGLTPRCEALEDRVALSFGSQYSGEAASTNPAVAKASDGTYVVAWYYYDSNADLDYVYAQRYGADDSEVGSEILLSDHGYGPSVAIDGQGDFVVAWRDTAEQALYAQEFDFSTGSAIASAFEVTQTQSEFLLDSCAKSPKVAMNAAGDMVFAWTRWDNATLSVWARAYDDQGAAVTDEFLVDDTNDDCAKPWVAMDSDGDFTVSYGRGVGSPSDPGKYEVHFQRYNASGVAQGSNTYVATSRDSTDNNHGPAIAMDSAGDFVIVWANSLTEDAVYAQVFNANGSSRTSVMTVADFGVNSDDIRPPYRPEVAMNASGDWVVTWGAPDDWGTWNVYAQMFDVDGDSLTSIMQVSVPTMYVSTNQLHPSVGIDSLGNFSIAWLNIGTSQYFSMQAGVRRRSYFV